jgi:hypothetical protein
LAPPESSGSRNGSDAGILQTILGNIKTLLRVAFVSFVLWKELGLLELKCSHFFISGGFFVGAKIYHLHGKSKLTI